MKDLGNELCRIKESETRATYANNTGSSAIWCCCCCWCCRCRHYLSVACLECWRRFLFCRSARINKDLKQTAGCVRHNFHNFTPRICKISGIYLRRPSRAPSPARLPVSSIFIRRAWSGMKFNTPAAATTKWLRSEGEAVQFPLLILSTPFPPSTPPIYEWLWFFFVIIFFGERSNRGLRCEFLTGYEWNASSRTTQTFKTRQRHNSLKATETDKREDHDQEWEEQSRGVAVFNKTDRLTGSNSNSPKPEKFHPNEHMPPWLCLIYSIRLPAWPAPPLHSVPRPSNQISAVILPGILKPLACKQSNYTCSPGLNTKQNRLDERVPEWRRFGCPAGGLSGNATEAKGKVGLHFLINKYHGIF